MCRNFETCARFDLNCLFQLRKPVSARNIEIKIYQNIFRNLTSSIELEIFALLFQRRIFWKLQYMKFTIIIRKKLMELCSVIGKKSVSLSNKKLFSSKFVEICKISDFD